MKLPKPPLPGVSEAEFLRQILTLARLHGWLVAHFRPAHTRTGWRTAVQGDGIGFPDVVMVRGRRLAVVEVKSQKGTLTASQERWLAKFEDAGARAFIWRPSDWAEIEAFLRGTP
jgi:hypothetical protein